MSPSWSLDDDDEKENALEGESEKNRLLLPPLLPLSFAVVGDVFATPDVIATADVADVGIDL